MDEFSRSRLAALGGFIIGAFQAQSIHAICITLWPQMSADTFRLFREATEPGGLIQLSLDRCSDSSPSCGCAATLAGCLNSSIEGSLEVLSAYLSILR